MSKHIMARLRQAELLSKISPCPRGQVGAVLFEPDSWVIISDGYNGTTVHLEAVGSYVVATTASATEKA